MEEIVKEITQEFSSELKDMDFQVKGYGQAHGTINKNILIKSIKLKFQNTNINRRV